MTTVFFNENPLSLKVDGFSTIVLTRANGSTATYSASSSDGPVISGSVIKVTGKDAAGTGTDYTWAGTVSMPASVLINVYAYNNAITFLATDITRATAKQVVVTEIKPTVFFDSNTLDLKIDGYATIVFTKADGSTVAYSAMSSNGPALSGPVIKVTGKMANGDGEDFYWAGHVVMAGAVLIVSYYYNNALTFLATDGTRATAKKDTPSLPTPSVFFQTNSLELTISTYATITFTFSNGQQIGYPASSTGGAALTGAVIKVTGQMANGDRTDYLWAGHVIMPSSFLVRAYAYNNALTFLATDNTRATAKPVPQT